MSRLALIAALLISLAAVTSLEAATTADPHLDPTVVLSGCAACHVGHGMSRSPMMPEPQSELCLGCHGSEADLGRQRSLGNIAIDARPPSLARVLDQPFVHALTPGAFSRRELGAVTCTSCHSPHRGSRNALAATGTNSFDALTGEAKVSTRDPAQLEYELCEICHGNEGLTSLDLFDISRLINPSNRSFHPVETPSFNRSASLDQSLAGRQINCSDCHGAVDSRAPRGIHGSAVRYILRGNHPTADGEAESATTYALCYGCHARDAVLDSLDFPEHRRHVVELRAACATCHNAHGSVGNRALIRFGEETSIAGVSSSMATGRLAFESMNAGEGSCYLTCHGVDHGPESYGGMDAPPPDPLGRQPFGR